MKLTKLSLRISAFLLLTSFFCAAVQGQNTTVSDAIQAFAAGEYQRTYTLTGNALANMDELSGDYLPAAFYYRAKSRIQVLRIAIEMHDEEMLNGMQNALIESYYDYKEAMKTADDKLKSDISYDLSELYNPILQTGLSALNTANDYKVQENVQKAALAAAKGYLAAAKDISPTYLACDLLGQAYLSSGDSLKALENFRESIQTYETQAMGEPDFLMAYAYFRQALIERYFMHDNVLALSTLKRGENLLTKQYSEISNAGSLLKESKNAYDNAMLDLIGFELDIYLNDSSLKDDAIIRFQEVMTMYPEDYDMHIAYANLLEDIDVNLAIDAYETAISIDDSKELAYFNIGAVYNNLGSELYMQGLNATDDALADSLYNESNVCFRKAYKYMEQAHYLNPNMLQTIRALVQLANSLGLDEQAEYYKEKEAALRGF